MKSFDYFSALEQNARLLQQACAVLSQCCGGYDFFRLAEQSRQAQAFAEETAAGHAALAQAVLADFLPPLQREDLLGISQSLAGLTGRAAGCLELLQAGQWPQLPEGAAALAKKAAAQAECLGRAVGELRSLKKTCAAQLEAAETLRALGREAAALASRANGKAARLADPRKLYSHGLIMGELAALCAGMSRAAQVLECAAVKNI